MKNYNGGDGGKKKGLVLAMVTMLAKMFFFADKFNAHNAGDADNAGNKGLMLTMLAKKV